MTTNQSMLKVKNKYFFKCSESDLPGSMVSAIQEIESVLGGVKIDSYKKSREKSKGNLFSPVDLNEKIKSALNAKGMSSRRISCNYSGIDQVLQSGVDAINDFFVKLLPSGAGITKKSFEVSYGLLLGELAESSLDMFSGAKAWHRLTKGYTSHDDQACPAQLVKKGRDYFAVDSVIADGELVPYLVKDFVGFREIDFIYSHTPDDKKVGIEVQFGKYAFMVYNVCAKMKIFQKAGLINYGIEIVPSKNMQKFMSTGVSFFEQFVWDLENRGAFQEDVPVVVLSIEPNSDGFDMLKSNQLTEVSISRSM